MSVTVQITKKSGNSKTGPIPVTTTSSESCPSACPLKGSGCYAESGPLALHWRKVTAGERGGEWDELTDFVRDLPPAQVWRHNQAGDLPHNDQTIDADKVAALVEANHGRRGFTYTHHDMSLPGNADVVREANLGGFAVNLSGNNPEHADELAELGIGPVVTVLPSDATGTMRTPAGRRMIACPATQRDDVDCESCKLCANPRRTVIIGFPVHGTSKKKAANATGNA